MAENIYNKMNKTVNNYQTRMNKASDQAAKIIRNMKKAGEKP